MAEGLFRPEAVSAYENPEARGGLLVARPPSGWLPLTGIVGALLVGLVFLNGVLKGRRSSEVA